MLIISFIWLVFNLSVCVPRPCLYMLGSPILTQVCACATWLTPAVCGRRIYDTRSSRDVSRRRTFQRCSLGKNTFNLGILVRDHLIMLPPRTKQNKMHKHINITCKCNMWHGIAILCLWSPSPRRQLDHHQHHDCLHQDSYYYYG